MFSRNDIVIHDELKNCKDKLGARIKAIFEAKQATNFDSKNYNAQNKMRHPEEMNCLSENFGSPDTAFEELTSSDLCADFLDQLEFTKRSWLSTSEPESRTLRNFKIEYFTEFGADEGLGEPEEESDNHKKIVAKTKLNKQATQKETKVDKDVERSLYGYINAPKATRNNRLINFYDYDSDNSSLFKTENLSARMNTPNDLFALYDPAQIIKEFKESKFHHHSKSGMTQEFKPLFKKHRPKILVEGEEHVEQGSEAGGLLCSRPSKRGRKGSPTTLNGLQI